MPQGIHRAPNQVKSRCNPRDSSETRLEKALEAMGDVQGPAVEVLKTELTKAWAASKPGRKFIARSERRIRELDTACRGVCSQDRGPGKSRDAPGEAGIHRGRSARDQETSSREAGEFMSRSSRSRPSDAKVRPQRRDVVVARPSSRLSTCSGAR